jgi:hypothetical protein
LQSKPDGNKTPVGAKGIANKSSRKRLNAELPVFGSSSSARPDSINPSELAAAARHARVLLANRVSSYVVSRFREMIYDYENRFAKQTVARAMNQRGCPTVYHGPVA